ncbi:hypothetical protein [Nocardia sp. NPDC004604]|uniref:hypothetical protein n=1 Tax=Nocardia sp. NPDC004604 TaxID=3157013 RepID=UPI0033ADBA77
MERILWYRPVDGATYRMSGEYLPMSVQIGSAERRNATAVSATGQSVADTA